MADIILSRVTEKSQSDGTEKLLIEYQDDIYRMPLSEIVNNSGSSGSVQIDDTLTLSGYAADAAAAGNRISTIEEQIANKAASSHTHATDDITNGTLPIAQGGTGATARKTAMYNIASIGENPITSTTNDTTAKWAELGTGYAFYNATGQLNGQPGQWGLLYNIVHGAEVFQIWNSQSGGATYFRSGNADGFKNSWRTVLDTSITTDYVVAHGTSGIWTYRKWSSGIAECWGTTPMKTINTVAWGQVVEGDGSIASSTAYPFSFITTPTVTAAPIAGDYSFWITSEWGGNASYSPTFDAVRPTAATVTGAISMHAIGRWK